MNECFKLSFAHTNFVEEFENIEPVSYCPDGVALWVNCKMTVTFWSFLEENDFFPKQNLLVCLDRLQKLTALLVFGIMKYGFKYIADL